MKNVNIISKRSQRDILGEVIKNGFAEIHGELEVFGSKNGKVFHYDKGENQVTIWAKHAIMKLLTGESFNSQNDPFKQRIFDSEDSEAHVETSPGEGRNTDGTLLSGQQYFGNNSSPDFNLESRWSRSTIDPNVNIGDGSNNEEQVKYPFFPTKMLFGTGFEFQSWGDLEQFDLDNQTNFIEVLLSQGWNQTEFNSNIANTANDYSANWSGTGADSLIPMRTINDISAEPIAEELDDKQFAVKGAIKNGLYIDSTVQRTISGATGANIRTRSIDGREFLIRPFSGIGRPSFIYSNRDVRYFQSGSEVGLSADLTPPLTQPEGQINDIYNRITFQVVMPEQTGDNVGIFYPYNGYTLKEAGLFCDARIFLNNTVPGVGQTRERDLYTVMPYGIMYAKRYISPITKTHDVSITSRWTLFV